MSIHVGNLAREVTAEQLREAFEPFGQVVSVRIITDKRSGESKGFAFVEMKGDVETQAAIEGLNRQELAGRALDLSEARPFAGGKRGGGPRRGGGGKRPGRGFGGGSSGRRKRRSF